GGFEDVYEFGKFFRNEGMSPQHNPEFTMLEMFVGGADYEGVMRFVEVLVASVVQQVMGTTKVERDGVEIDFAAPWPRVRLRDELLRETGLDIYEASRDELAEAAGDAVGPDDDWAGVVDTLQGKFVEPKLIQPTYIIDLPIDIWPLVKVHEESPRVCEAFDGIVAGMEIVGGGTDLNDPIEQKERFVKQRERQEKGAEPDPHPNDEEFVRALEAEPQGLRRRADRGHRGPLRALPTAAGGPLHRHRLRLRRDDAAAGRAGRRGRLRPRHGLLGSLHRGRAARGGRGRRRAREH